MENHHHTDLKGIYACPMHPEVTGKEGDSCSKCGMHLKAVQAESPREHQVELTTLPSTVEAGVPAKLILAIKENEQYVPLDVSHEMKIHLMVVNEDLTWFRHIHPEEQTDGSYTITETFPNGGKYLLFVDFKPSGAAQALSIQKIEVQGKRSTVDQDISNKWTLKVDGYRLTLENGSDFKTNRTQPLQIAVEKDGKKLMENNLQQYLGASAHIVMIGKADKDFVHIHPISDSLYPIYAQTHIGKAGIYRMWVQFKIDGQVHTADFTVDVTPGQNSFNEEKQHGYPIL
jgi:hypothetical protein